MGRARELVGMKEVTCRLVSFKATTYISDAISSFSINQCTHNFINVFMWWYSMRFRVVCRRFRMFRAK